MDLNATQAAIRAGYSEKTAAVIGNENLIKPYIQEYIRYLQKKISDKLEVTTEKVVREYAKLAFSSIKHIYDEEGELIPIHELPDDVASALSEIKEDTVAGVVLKKAYKMHSKTAALDALGKHLGLFEKDNKQKGEGSGTVIILPAKKRDEGA